MFYRFTYPDSSSYVADSYLYDGERLYYQYGVPKLTNTRNIVFPNGFNTNGEGGGNLILTNNNMDYISFGIATYVVGTRHSLMSNGIFYAINEIIKNDLFKTNKPRRKIRIAPNPSNDMISIIGLLPTEFVRIDIYDDLGKLMGNYEEINLESRISVEDWPPGTYHTYLYGINYHAHLKFIRF